jgi:hypothetical protein
MTRIQFWFLTVASAVLVLLLLLQVLLARDAQYAQARVLQAQQVVTQGRASDAQLRQLASRVYQVSQQTQDQGLKDLLVRQHIFVNPPGGSTGSTDSTVPSPTPTR